MDCGLYGFYPPTISANFRRTSVSGRLCLSPAVELVGLRTALPSLRRASRRASRRCVRSAASRASPCSRTRTCHSSTPTRCYAYSGYTCCGYTYPNLTLILTVILTLTLTLTPGSLDSFSCLPARVPLLTPSTCQDARSSYPRRQDQRSRPAAPACALHLSPSS